MKDSSENNGGENTLNSGKFIDQYRNANCTDNLKNISTLFTVKFFVLRDNFFSERIIFTLRQVGILLALARYFSLSRLAVSIPTVEIFNYLATGECDKDCFRRNVTEHLSAGYG